MNYHIVELEEFSGTRAKIYSIIMEEDLENGNSLFDHFVIENSLEYKKELKSILGRLEQINITTGAREHFFKLDEGSLGDGVCALFDDPNKKLRLYCIRYGNVAIILGGGGPKPSKIRKWQEDKKLTYEAETIKKVSRDITERLRSGDLKWSEDGSQLLGNLNISDNEED